jgi:hypothetical protein
MQRRACRNFLLHKDLLEDRGFEPAVVTRCVPRSYGTGPTPGGTFSGTLTTERTVGERRPEVLAGLSIADRTGLVAIAPKPCRGAVPGTACGWCGPGPIYLMLL